MGNVLKRGYAFLLEPLEGLSAVGWRFWCWEIRLGALESVSATGRRSGIFVSSSQGLSSMPANHPASSCFRRVLLLSPYNDDMVTKRPS